VLAESTLGIFDEKGQTTFLWQFFMLNMTILFMYGNLV